MNEAETRAELIDPKLKASGWSVVDGSKVLREHPITAGKIQTGGVENIRSTFIEFQKYLYEEAAAYLL